MITTFRRRLWVLVVLLPAVLGCRSAGTAGEARPAVAAPPLTVIGLCEDYPEESRSIEAADRDLARLQTLGVTRLRVALGWDGIETKPGVYDFAFWDQFFDLADRHGVKLIPYVCYTPAWAAKSPANPWRQPPADVKRFGAFVTAVVSRYRGRTGSWELWNEPDNREYWEGTTAEFADLVRAGAAAVRKADPAAKVVLGGISWNADFVVDLLANYRIADSVDVINVHDYSETWNPDPIEHIPDLIGRIAAAIEQHGDNERIWMAEVGYSDFRRGDAVSAVYTAKTPEEHTAAYQAGALLRMLASAMSTGRVDLFAWYRLNDLPAAQDVIGDVNNRHLGLVGVDGREKPAFEAMRQAVRALAGATRCLDARLDVGPPAAARVHAFGRADGEMIVVAWLPTGAAAAEVTARLPGGFGLQSLFDPAGTGQARAFARGEQTDLRLAIKPGQTLLIELRPTPSAGRVPLGH